MKKVMKNLILVACIGKKNELGINNDLIWKFAEDLQTFRSITAGAHIVMGRNTFFSLPKMLPGRKHLVIAHTPDGLPDEVVIFQSVEAFIEFAESYNDIIYVIGGGVIYKELLPYCEKLILTEVDATYDGGVDCIYFPEFRRINYTVTSSEDFVDLESQIKYTRNVYVRT